MSLKTIPFFLFIIFFPFDISAQTNFFDSLFTFSSNDTLVHIFLGGKLDGENTFSREYTKTFDPLISLSIFNKGSNVVRSPRLIINNKKNWYTVEKIAEECFEGTSSVKEKSLALWKFVKDNRNHRTPPGPWEESSHATQLLGMYGYGLCGNTAWTVLEISKTLTDKLRYYGLFPLPGLEGRHVISEIAINDSFNLIDSDIEVFYLNLDNTTLASQKNITEDRHLIRRTHHYGKTTGINSSTNNFVATLYTPAIDEMYSKYTSKITNNQSLDFLLRPGEGVLFDSENGALFHSYQQINNTEAKERTNGMLLYRTNFIDGNFNHILSEFSEITINNLENQKPGIHASNITDNSNFIIKISSPFVILSSTVKGIFHQTATDKIKIQFSMDSLNWEEVWVSDCTGVFRDSLDLFNQIGTLKSPAIHSFFLKFMILPVTSLDSCGMDSLEIYTPFQISRFFLPALTLGTNTIHYTDQESESRNIEVNIHWKENLSYDPPNIITSPVYPLDKSNVDSLQFTFKWVPSDDKINVPIIDYEFELSDREDMKYPLSPTFNIYIKPNHKTLAPEFRIPEPGLLNDGTTYFWRVRAKNSYGVWSPWSAVWSFIPHGVMLPVNGKVAISNNDIILTWEENKLGHKPAFYEIHASNEWLGFSPSENTLLDTTLSDKYIIPFKTNPKIFYRIVAVNQNGEKSNPSRVIELPYPFIFSVPDSIIITPDYKMDLLPQNLWYTISISGKSIDTVLDSTIFIKFIHKPPWLSYDSATKTLHGIIDSSIYYKTLFDSSFYLVKIELQSFLTGMTYNQTFKLQSPAKNTIPFCLSGDSIAEANRTFSKTIYFIDKDTLSGDHLSYKILSKPSWLNVLESDFNYIKLYGTPSELNTGDTLITLIVYDLFDSIFQSYSIKVLLHPKIEILTIKNVSCANGSDGVATASVMEGGTPAFQFLWSNGDTSSIVSGLSTGLYSVTVTDKNQFTTIASIFISEPQELTLNITGVDPYCYGTTDGNITINPNGGASPYLYQWNNGQINPTVFSLGSGTYTVTVTDNNLCTSSSSFTLSDPPVLSVSSTVMNATCNSDSDGVASASAFGGSDIYFYEWSNGKLSPVNSGLEKGTYTVTVTDSKSCTATAQATITDPDTLAVTVSKTEVSCNGGTDGSAMAIPEGGTSPYEFVWNSGQVSTEISSMKSGTYYLTVTDANSCSVSTWVDILEPSVLSVATFRNFPSCYGGSDGSATAVPDGGEPPYSFAWSSGQVQSTISGLSAGVYRVTITDNHSCTVTTDVTLENPDAMVLQISTTNSTCGEANGSAAVNIIAGGSPPYIYQWTNGSVSASLTNLVASSYGVTVTDSNSCISSAWVTLTDIEGPAVSANTSNPTCYEGINGIADVTVSGGTAPYIYSWSHSAQAGAIASDLGSGTYYVTVTDSMGCKNIQSITLSAPPAISVLVNEIQSSCFSSSDGYAGATSSGGTPPYTYSWSNGLTTSEAYSLGSGTYYLTVSDTHGCGVTDSAVITVPKELNVSVSWTHPTCYKGANGKVIANISGGSPSFSFEWNNSQLSPVNSGLEAGTYTVTVTDGKSCTATAQATITAPDALAVTITKTEVSCNGGADGSAMVIPEGGTFPYYYLWSNNQKDQINTKLSYGVYYISVTDFMGCTASNFIMISEPLILEVSSIFDEILCHEDTTVINITASGGTIPYTGTGAFPRKAGTYNFTVKDSKGCISETSVIIQEPTFLLLTLDANSPTCNESENGVISTRVSGGTMPYRYSWSNGLSGTSISLLKEGRYGVIITDANNCMVSGSCTLVKPTEIEVLINSSNPSCNGKMNGTVSTLVSGGTLPYLYQWSSGHVSPGILNLPSGKYSVTVTDKSGCTGSNNILLQDSIAFSIGNFFIRNISCFENSDGAISVTPYGGAAPYFYYWSNGLTAGTISGLYAGTYFLTLEDKNNCVIIDSFNIEGVAPINASIINESDELFLNNTFPQYLKAQPEGNSYKWSDGSISQTNMIFRPGEYYVVVTDKNFCSDTSNSIFIQEIESRDEESNIPYITIHPNPVNSLLTMKISPNLRHSPISIIIFNASGQIVETNYRKEMDGGRIVVDLSSFANGYYLLEMMSYHKRFQKHFFIQR